MWISDLLIRIGIIVVAVPSEGLRTRILYVLRLLNCTCTMSWVNAIVAVSIISTIPNLLLYLIPASYENPWGINIQHVMLSFASGGLLGDVFIHAMPHILLSDNESFNTKDGHVRAIIIGTLCLMGFFIFYVIEKIVSAWSVEPNKTIRPKEKVALKPEGTHKRTQSRGRKGKEGVKEEISSSSGNSVSTANTTTSIKSSSVRLKPAAILNLIADVMHNFCDGLAIGATYASGRSLAFATTISIFFHEIPHELGDYSVLVESGYTKEQAIKTQMVPLIFHFTSFDFILICISFHFRFHRSLRYQLLPEQLLGSRRSTVLQSKIHC